MRNFPCCHIRPVVQEDVAAMTDIYNGYILNSTATFETAPISDADMQTRVAAIIPSLYWVCEADGKLAGYCYAHPWKERAAYAHTWETTVYLSPGYTGRGIGICLMQRLIEKCRLVGCHALIACITAENSSSRALHRKLGFRQVSYFREVGQKFGRWLDVADYELLL